MSLTDYILNNPSRKKIVCMIASRGHTTWCLYDKGEDNWEPPCQTCSFRSFYGKKQWCFLFTQWKGWMVGTREEWEVKYPAIKDLVGLDSHDTEE